MKKETKIAITAVVALILLFIGINFLKGINVFQSTNTYYVKFKDVAGLTVSTPVYANGYPVGIVRTIDYDYQQGKQVVVGIELDDEMSVPRQTRAELAKELMGGVTMTLLLGPNPVDNIAKGDTISGSIHSGAMDGVAEMMPQIEQMVPKLDSILTNINRITSDPALMETLHNAAKLSANLNNSAVKLDRMMQNDIPQLVATLQRTGNNAERLTANLAAIDVQTTIAKANSTLESANDLANRLNTTVGNLNTKISSRDNTLGLLLNDRGVYDNLNATLRNADSLMIDLKAHPKRYVHFSVFGKKDK